jgi:hypothetical protein
MGLVEQTHRQRGSQSCQVMQRFLRQVILLQNLNQGLCFVHF